MEGVWRVSGGCQDGVWMVSGGFNVGLGTLEIQGKCLKELRGCLEGV